MKAICLFSISIVTAVLATGCGDHASKTAKTAADTNATPKYDTGNPLTVAPDYLGAVMQAKNYSEKQINVSYINEDIEMFNASEGRYPKDLQELIPNYLAKMPELPKGFKLVYDDVAHTVKVVKQ